MMRQDDTERHDAVLHATARDETVWYKVLPKLGSTMRYVKTC